MIKRITKGKQLYFFKKFKECPEFWAEYIEGRVYDITKKQNIDLEKNTSCY